MKLTIKIYILILLLTSCNIRQKINDHRAGNKIEWLKKHNYLKFPDTTNKSDSTPITLNDSAVQNAIDSMSALCQELNRKRDSINNLNIPDSSKQTAINEIKKEFKKKAEPIIKSIPCEINPIDIETELYSLHIWTKDGNLAYDLKVTPQPEKICPEFKLSWWTRNMFWIGIIFGMVALWIIDKIITKLFGRL